MPHRKFPLKQGHVYAMGLKPHRHDGSVDAEGLHLIQVQTALRVRWKYDHVTSTGRIDGPTQDAIVRIQHAHGMTPNGELDEATWDLILSGTPQ